MISTADFKKGQRFEWNGEPWVVLDSTTQSPSARGGATLVKAKVKNVLTGQFQAVTFKSGEKFREPDIEMRNGQFLYVEGEHYYFLDSATYDQVPLDADLLGDQALYLTENMEVRLVFYNERPVGLELPNTAVYEITQCDPGIKGDTVTAVTKEAVVETGLRVQVPLFLEQGERIRVDTRDGRYLERAK
ncbi:MAG: elongation factor P [Myxococcales bacterium]